MNKNFKVNFTNFLPISILKSHNSESMVKLVNCLVRPGSDIENDNWLLFLELYPVCAEYDF